MHFKREGEKKWEERTTGQTDAGFVLSDLEENSLYHIYVRAVSRDGELSEPSATVSVRTSGEHFRDSSVVKSV